MVKIRVGTGGNDNITGDANSHNIMFGLAGDDHLTGGNLADLLVGGAGNDTLNGGGGDDYLAGDAGVDTLNGGDGNDFLLGGTGGDILTGGSGSDTFAFISVTDSQPGMVSGTPRFDTIADFQEHSLSIVDADTLGLTLIDADKGTLGNQGFTFGGDNTNVVAHSVTFFQSGGNTVVQADVNGDTTADFRTVLTGLHNLTSNDFLL